VIVGPVPSPEPFPEQHVLSSRPSRKVSVSFAPLRTPVRMPKLTIVPLVGETFGNAFPGWTPTSRCVQGGVERMQLSEVFVGGVVRSLPTVIVALALAGSSIAIAAIAAVANTLGRNGRAIIPLLLP
jgi:hypothetical protein